MTSSLWSILDKQHKFILNIPRYFLDFALYAFVSRTRMFSFRNNRIFFFYLIYGKGSRIFFSQEKDFALIFSQHINEKRKILKRQCWQLFWMITATQLVWLSGIRAKPSNHNYNWCAIKRTYFKLVNKSSPYTGELNGAFLSWEVINYLLKYQILWILTDIHWYTQEYAVLRQSRVGLGLRAEGVRTYTCNLRGESGLCRF